MRRKGPTSALRSVAESELEGAILELAGLLGWRRAHFRPAMLPSGRWATHMRGDKGFPDLVLAKRGRRGTRRRGRLIIAELKRTGEEPTAEQWEWLEILDSVPGIEVAVWWTEDWVSGAIEAALSGSSRPARLTRRPEPGTGRRAATRHQGGQERVVAEARVKPRVMG